MGSACRCTTFHSPSSGRRVIVTHTATRTALEEVSSLPNTFAFIRSMSTTQARSSVTYFSTISKSTPSPSVNREAACSGLG